MQIKTLISRKELANGPGFEFWDKREKLTNIWEVELLKSYWCVHIN